MYAYVFEEGGEREGGIRGGWGSAVGKYDDPIQSGECFFIHDIPLQFFFFGGFRHSFSY